MAQEYIVASTVKFVADFYITVKSLKKYTLAFLDTRQTCTRFLLSEEWPLNSNKLKRNKKQKKEISRRFRLYGVNVCVYGGGVYIVCVSFLRFPIGRFRSLWHPIGQVSFEAVMFEGDICSQREWSSLSRVGFKILLVQRTVSSWSSASYCSHMDPYWRGLPDGNRHHQPRSMLKLQQLLPTGQRTRMRWWLWRHRGVTSKEY